MLYCSNKSLILSFASIKACSSRSKPLTHSFLNSYIPYISFESLSSFSTAGIRRFPLPQEISQIRILSRSCFLFPFLKYSEKISLTIEDAIFSGVYIL